MYAGERVADEKVLCDFERKNPPFLTQKIGYGMAGEALVLATVDSDNELASSGDFPSSDLETCFYILLVLVVHLVAEARQFGSPRREKRELTHMVWQWGSGRNSCMELRGC